MVLHDTFFLLKKRNCKKGTIYFYGMFIFIYLVIKKIERIL